MKQSVLAWITRVMLYLLLIAVLSCMVLATFSSAWFPLFFYGPQHITISSLELFLRIFVYAAGSIAIWILIELILVLRTLSSDPFVERNCRAFLRMGIVALITGALFIASAFVVFTFTTMICAVVMILCGMFALVLAEVFKKAIAYKRENDLTI